MRQFSLAVSIFLMFFGGDWARCQTSPSTSDSTPGQSQTEEQRIEALEKKVDGLEKNVTAILQQRKVQQEASPTNRDGDNPQSPPQLGSATPSKEVRKRFPGPSLQVWALPTEFHGDTPPGMPIGTMADDGTLFNMGNFLAVESFQSLKDQFVGLKWKGIYEIKEKGFHNIILERVGGRWPWFASLKIGGNTIFSDLAPGPSVKAQPLELEPGWQTFELFAYSRDLLNCAAFRLIVKIGAASSLEATVLDAKNVFHYYP